MSGLLQRALVGEPAPEASRLELAAEVDARLDRGGGLDDYSRDDEWRAEVIAHFESASLP